MFALLTDRSCRRENGHRYSFAKTNNNLLFTRKKGRKRGFNSIYPIKTAENKQTKQTKNKRKQTKNKQKTNETKQTINKQNKRKQQNNENKQNKQNKRTLTKTIR